MPDPIEDPYPSRGAEPRWTARREPVLWDPAAPGPLSLEQRARFDDDGFLLLPDLLAPAELAPLQDAADHLAGTERRDAEVIVEPESETVRSVFAIHLGRPWASLIADPRLAGAARQLLADDVYVHQSRINFKPGFEGREFDWHSDFETWHAEDGMPRMRAVSCVLMLSETLVSNGPLMLVPGSHRVHIGTVGETPERNYERSLRRQEIGVPDRRSLTKLCRERGIAVPTGAPGSVLFFDCNTLHGSGPNLTPFPRHNLFFVYNAVSNALVAPYCGRPPRPEHIAHREHVAAIPRAV